MTIYPAHTPPSGNSAPLPAWTVDNVPRTDGSERELGKNAFLTMLLTQLQNQDPTSPMENTDMAAQLAQFSQLEQLTNMSESIDNLGGYIQVQNQFQTLTMIGKYVVTGNNELSVTDGKTDVEASVNLTESASLLVYIIDSNGDQVRMINMDKQPAGEHKIKWDGKDNNNKTVEDGLYSFIITATNAKGETIKDEDGVVFPQTAGVVTSVAFDGNGAPVIQMGHVTLGLGSVSQIRDKAPASNDEDEDKDEDKGEDEDKDKDEDKGEDSA